MQVQVSWFRIEDGTEILWKVNRGLYAYLTLDDEIIYIGKVSGKTVRQRFYLSAKPNLWSLVESNFGHTDVQVLVGIVDLPPGNRFSRQLLSDIESLLIYNIAPAGNKSCRNTRISRPGLSVKCGGYWPHFDKKFVDL